jgi:hypothetical protein
MSVIASPLSPDSQRDPLALFLFFSLLLHLLFLLFFPFWGRQPLTLPPQEQLAEVELLPPTPPPTPPAVAKIQPPLLEKEKPTPEEKKLEEKPEEKPEPQKHETLPEQIVSPPNNANDEVPENTRFLSDRNSSTKEQTVASGNPLPSPPQKTKAQPKEKPEPPKQETSKPPTQLAMKAPETKPIPKPSLEKAIEKPSEALEKDEPPKKNLPLGQPGAPAKAPQLFARPDDLLTQGWLSDAGKNQQEEKKAEHQPPQGRDLIALAPPPRESLLSLPGPLGTPDFLPDIRQGGLTLLNTKAHRFAPFVRRVALRVFQHLIIHQRKQLKLDDVIAAREMVTVQAKLDTQGNLKKLLIQTRSGSYAVDASLLEACKQGAWDENPPPEAVAEDGFINFIFRSDITPQYDQIGLRAIVTYLQIGLL